MFLGMKWNGEAFKAWVASLIGAGMEWAASGNGLAGVLIKGLEAAFSFDIPAQFETYIAMGVAWLVSYAAVYWTSNKPAMV